MPSLSSFLLLFRSSFLFFFLSSFFRYHHSYFLALFFVLLFPLRSLLLYLFLLLLSLFNSLSPFILLPFLLFFSSHLSPFFSFSSLLSSSILLPLPPLSVLASPCIFPPSFLSLPLFYIPSLFIYLLLTPCPFLFSPSSSILSSFSLPLFPSILHLFLFPHPPSPFVSSFLPFYIISSSPFLPRLMAYSVLLCSLESSFSPWVFALSLLLSATSSRYVPRFASSLPCFVFARPRVFTFLPSLPHPFFLPSSFLRLHPVFRKLVPCLSVFLFPSFLPPSFASRRWRSLPVSLRPVAAFASPRRRCRFPVSSFLSVPSAVRRISSPTLRFRLPSLASFLPCPRAPSCPPPSPPPSFASLPSFPPHLYLASLPRVPLACASFPPPSSRARSLRFASPRSLPPVPSRTAVSPARVLSFPSRLPLRRFSSRPSSRRLLPPSCSSLPPFLPSFRKAVGEKLEPLRAAATITAVICPAAEGLGGRLVSQRGLGKA
ncbi:hypothetical protein C7M84_021431 [Penaeus vannamei]|uniref:Uncharacterized protein n=1 Tax=Penaeus vannamei TaxID=6689 RepID=A0A3R7SH09_PENVA|nr:hypothetical protein C7M84_021431 [Penaeus vannamei]